MTHLLVTASLSLTHIAAIATQFAGRGQVTAVQPFGSGNINDTYLATFIPSPNSPEERFILQRINTHVFRQPHLIMQNMRVFTEHVRSRLACDPLSADCSWQVPRVLLTRDGKDHWIDTNGEFWRAISFIEGAETFDTIQDTEHATSIGYSLGTFHRLVSDLTPHALADTLEGFHITPNYVQQYEQVLATPIHAPTQENALEVAYCHQFISDRKEWAHVLETAKTAGKLPMRTIHGDPKINNVMFDKNTRQAVSIIDLDTIKPGLVHYDIGDCLRSACNVLGEETEDWESVKFDPNLCHAILCGYLAEAQAFLTPSDYEYLFDAIRLIAFELGLRFFADYLAGNPYFKVKHPSHNLTRALVQFKLTESIEAQASTIHTLIQDLK